MGAMRTGPALDAFCLAPCIFGPSRDERKPPSHPRYHWTRMSWSLITLPQRSYSPCMISATFSGVLGMA